MILDVDHTLGVGSGHDRGRGRRRRRWWKKKEKKSLIAKSKGRRRTYSANYVNFEN